MRVAFLLAFCLCSRAEAQTSPDRPEDARSRETARAALARNLVARFASQYAITADPGRTPLTLDPAPVLKLDNVVEGSVHGAVFVYSDQGRPAVVASIYKWFAPGNHVGVEFVSLARGPVAAEYDGKTVWEASRAGITPAAIPKAPKPARTPAERLRQLRALAAQFSATETTPSNGTRGLRLLTHPISRYATSESDPTDGALFAFVQGGDPEALLLIEARGTGGEPPVWQYAFVRATYCELKAVREGRTMWSASALPLSPSSLLHDRREPYTEFIFEPGQGANPLEAP